MSLLPFDDEPGRGSEESDSEIWEWSESDMVVIYISALVAYLKNLLLVVYQSQGASLQEGQK